MNPPPPDQAPLQQAMTTDAYLAAMSPSIANPTPSYASAPVHPPYAEMIMAAIAALKEVDGSSKKAIAKYIEGAFPYLPSAHPALLTHHLKRLKNSGQLVMLKKSYMLPPLSASGSDRPPSHPPVVAAASPSSSSVKRRPGRPPKPKTLNSDPRPPPGEISVPSAGLAQNSGGVSSKRRGRPPKPKPGPPGFEYQENQQQQQQQEQPVYAAVPLVVVNAGLFNGNASPLSQRRPGRPPKYLATAGEQVPVTTLTVGSAQVGGAAALVKRRPGRPPKSGNRPRGRPRKNDGSVALPLPSAPRGRPRKRPLLAVDGGNGNVAAAAAVGIRRRGRPKGVTTGPRKLMTMRTGRPRGRPRKNALIVSTHASGQSEVTASVELTRKLEYMQLKVKNAVGLLKPHLINANIIDILTAIQDLEELATMDIVAPTIRETETAPMAEPIAPTMAQETASPTDVAAPVLDLSAPAYPDPGVVSQLHVTFS